MTSKPGPPWRSLRFWAKLCAAVAIIPLAVFVGAVCLLRWNASAQRIAVAAIKEAHGRVEYDWENPDVVRSSARFSIAGLEDWLNSWTPSSAESEDGGPPAPHWLVSLLGVDCFGHVTSVSAQRAPDKFKLVEHVGQLKRLSALRLTGFQLSDQEMTFLDKLDCLEELTFVRCRLGNGTLSQLAGLKNLKSLNLHGSNVNSLALANIQGLTALTELNLSGTAIDGAALASLRGLSNLQGLDLDRTAIDDSGLAVLANLTALIRLSLNGTKLSGVGLVHLKGLNRLEELSLEGTRVSDAGLAHLAGLTRLKVLELKGTLVGDAGLKYLKDFSNLETLTLDRTAVTDAGLAHLTVLPHLVVVSVQHTKVTEAGITEMKRQRAALQAQQLATTTTGVTAAGAGITDVEIMH